MIIIAVGPKHINLREKVQDTGETMRKLMLIGIVALTSTADTSAQIAADRPSSGTPVESTAAHKPGWLGYTDEPVGSLCPAVIKLIMSKGAKRIDVNRKGTYIDSFHTRCSITIIYTPTWSLTGSAREKIASSEAKRGQENFTIMDEACKAIGGRIEQGWRVPPQEWDKKVRTYACRVNDVRRFAFDEYSPWHDAKVRKLTIVEPKNSELATNARYLGELEHLGWYTVEKLESKRRQAVALAERERDRERPLKRIIGTRVCREEDGVTFTGFVEQRSPDSDKIQIRVASAQLTINRNVRPTAFAPSIIWDQPDNWRLCD